LSRNFSASRTGADEQRSAAMLQSMHAMLHPQSIAIVGATERVGYGSRLVGNLLKGNHKARLYPVNPARSTVFGLSCARTIAEVPERVDLAVIILAADQVIVAFRECIEAGARAVLVISAGFAESGTAEGLARQSELAAMARASGVRVCGPNCLGFANVPAGMWITSSPRIDFTTPVRTGGIALVSQSGATCYSSLLAMAHDRRIGFRYLAATGNEADLESSDFMRYMVADPDVKVIAALIEGFKSGPNFVRAAEMALHAGKPVVILKIGRSEPGSRAASTHTAAMTGSDAVHDALFTQKGVVRVEDYDELLETAAMFEKAPIPRGGRVGVVSESGGMGSFLADKCGELGLEVPALSDSTREKLVAIMGERGAAANPADLTLFGLSATDLPRILGHLLQEDRQDLMIMSSIGGDVQAEAFVNAAAQTDKPILFAWAGSSQRLGLEMLQESKLPLFSLPGKAALAAKRLARYHERRRSILSDQAGGIELAEQVQRHERLDELLALAAGAPLTEAESKLVLSWFDVPSPAHALCASAEDAVRAAARIGYPVALKVLSRHITHKTEAGGVRLNIGDRQALDAAWDGIVAAVRSRSPEARIEGMLVEHMVSGGIELIVGVSHDSHFGPVLMLGMGGVLAELVASAAWRVCPINRREAGEMIEQIKGLSQLLSGYRGLPPLDRGALIETLVNVSTLGAVAADSIRSLDINPVSVLPQGAGVIALDALIVPASSR
jgi:acyl-CoA synthetase (NDP forming)